MARAGRLDKDGAKRPLTENKMKGVPDENTDQNRPNFESDASPC